MKRIYTGKIKELAGNKVVPVNLPPDSETGSAFLKEIVGKTPQAYKEYCVAQQVKGLGAAPMIQKTSEAVIAIVSQVPGAIGYISADKLNNSVKRIEIK